MQTPSEPVTEAPIYNFEKEYLVKNMILSDGKLFTAQISSWRSEWKAESEAANFKEQGYDAFVHGILIEKLNEYWFQVRIGYFKTYREALESAEKLR